MSFNPPPHVSIFLEEFLELFNNVSLRCFVDATLGAGGHSEAILEAHPEIEMWIGIDRDEDSLNLAKERLQSKLIGKRAHFLHCDFLQAAKEVTDLEQFQGCDGIFFDIGVSSMQFDQAHRGFSIRNDGPLDMRMNRDQALDAKKIVNSWSAKQLEEIFREYGEEPHARKAAQMILLARQKNKIETTGELVLALDGLWRGSHKHPATRVFQALRIAVNDELRQLEQALPLWMDQLTPGGRLGVIAFHSLEERIVKNQMRDRAKAEKWTLVTPKPLEVSSREIRKNPRSRSAKLRFIEKPLLHKDDNGDDREEKWGD